MFAATQNTTSLRGMEGRLVITPRAGALVADRHPGPSWASAAPATVGSRFPIIAESLSAAIGLERGQRVLELGAGSGHVAVSAGRRGCQVASVISPETTPYQQALLERDTETVASEQLAVDFWRWEIARVPFQDGEFDVVASSFATMFEPDQEAMADQVLRLCRPGGKIGFASWTPESFVGQLFRTIDTYLPAEEDAASPFLWGTEHRIEELFGAEAQSIDATSRTFMFRYDSVQQFIDIWTSTYEPLRQALQSMDSYRQKALVRDLRRLVGRHNVATDGSVALRGEYLEVVVRKRGQADQESSH
jgi:SAM-dependent methyltransferase